MLPDHSKTKQLLSSQSLDRHVDQLADFVAIFLCLLQYVMRFIAHRYAVLVPHVSFQTVLGYNNNVICIFKKYDCVTEPSYPMAS